MVRDFQAILYPSLWRKMMIGALALAMLGCALMYFQGMRLVVLLLALGLATTWAWRDPLPVRHIVIDDEYRAWLLLHQDDETLHEAELLAGSLIHRWGCFLKWRCNGRVFWLAVLPDMLDADGFRKLRVWARFGQKV